MITQDRHGVLERVVDPTLNLRRRPSRRRFARSKYARQMMVAALAFVVAAVLLGQLIPSPTIPSNVVFIGPKYDYYKAHKDEYDTLFFGSSRIYSHIVPEVFDQAAEAAGLETHSYNFGIPAMRAIDSAVLIKEVLASPPKNLKWVFFESILDKGYEPVENARTYRAIYWHTWENTRFAAHYILASDASLPEKGVLLASHLLPFLYHQLNVGRLFHQVLPSDLTPEEQMVAKNFTQAKGYFELTGEDDPTRVAFVSDQPGYRESVGMLKEMQANGGVEDAYLPANKEMLLAKVSDAIVRAGATAIFVEPPSLHMVNDLRSAAQLGKIKNLFAYKDPNQFPELYAFENRYDADHLNGSGAERFSKVLAEDLAIAAGASVAPELPRAILPGSKLSDSENNLS